MAIGLEFINLIIPIALIRDRYPGGWEACLRDHTPVLGKRVWYDEYLFRDGALSPDEVKARMEGWAILGFEPMHREGGGWRWEDLAIVDCAAGGATMPCHWLDVDLSDQSASFAHAPRTSLITRRNFANASS
jgi:hypothetical protein